MAAVFAISAVIDWAALPRPSTIAFPIAVAAALATLGATTSPGFAAPLTGVLTLCFAYLGLTQPPGSALFGLPFAATTLVIVYGRIDGRVAVRVIMGALVWVLLAELLARYARRHEVLTAALRAEANRDDLTGIANRRDLTGRLAATGPNDVIAICDLDHFKRINDTLGHAAGDRILADFGALLRSDLRAQDYCARYGGEEFVLVLPRTTPELAHRVIGRLQQRWATIMPDITFSAGIAARGDQPSVDTALLAADIALYEAKSAGRNRVVGAGAAERATVGPTG
jgi:diguanylate cyclase (GGDEF)-like protein